MTNEFRTTKELNPNEIHELKEAMFQAMKDSTGNNGEVLYRSADEITDEAVHDMYEGIVFDKDYFN